MSLFFPVFFTMLAFIAATNKAEHLADTPESDRWAAVAVFTALAILTYFVGVLL